MAAGPGPLQVIAAAVAVHIQHLAAGVEAGHKAAFHGLGVELVGAQAAGGDLCLIEAAHAVDIQRKAAQQRGDPLQIGSCQRVTGLAGDARRG